MVIFKRYAICSYASCSASMARLRDKKGPAIFAAWQVLVLSTHVYFAPAQTPTPVRVEKLREDGSLLLTSGQPMSF